MAQRAQPFQARFAWIFGSIRFDRSDAGKSTCHEVRMLFAFVKEPVVCVRQTCAMNCGCSTAESRAIAIKKQPDLFKVGLAYILGWQSSRRAEIVSTLVVTSAGLLLLTVKVSTLRACSPAASLGDPVRD